MKNTSLLFALLFPILGFAQSPTPSPRPVAGFIAGIQAPGTTIWSKPLTWVPAVPAGSKIVFIPGATVPTLGAVQLALAKKMAVQCLTDAYGKALSAGITVTTGALTMTLAAQSSDRQQFNELLTLLNTAAMPPTLTIADIAGNPQTVTVAQYYALIGSYGQQIAALWSALTTARASVAAAADAAGLTKITLGDPTGD